VYQEALWGEGKPSVAHADGKSAAEGSASDPEVCLSNCVQRKTSWLALCRREELASKDILTVELIQVQQVALIASQGQVRNPEQRAC